MVNVDSLEDIRKLDPKNIYGSIVALPNQLIHAWEDASQVKVPQNYQYFENVVLTGMGGSGLGARIIESVFLDKVNVPLVRVNDYHLPGFVNNKSLVICSSYSGNTEETLSNVQEAIDKKAMWMAIGTGGKLIDLAKREVAPFYKIDPAQNPSGQPRMAIGYSVIGQLVLCAKTGVITLEKQDILVSIDSMGKIQESLCIKFARKLKGKILVFVSAEHLVGAVHTINNQFNENAKTFSADFSIPEMNHHLLEGLKHPSLNKQNLFFIFFNSNLYSEKIAARMHITKDIVSKNGISHAEFKANAPTKLAQVFEAIQFGAFVNFYLSMLYNQDPAPIPWVDYFKRELSKEK